MVFKDTFYFWLYFIIPVLVLLIIIGVRRRRNFMRRLGGEQVIRKNILGVSPTKRFWKKLSLIIALSFLLLAIARPQMGVEKIRIKRRGVDILVLLDTSLSMAAQDIKPDRLTRAKMWIGTLIDDLVSDRIGIIAFAGKPFLQCPLTTDYSACRMLLDILDVGTIPVQGTNISGALDLAIKSFPEKKGLFKVIVLVTDGEDHEGRVEDAAEAAAEEGIKIIAIGIGSETGEPLPVKDETGNISGYKRDKSGNLVMSRLNRATLESAARKTDGAFFSATPGSFEMNRVVGILNKMEKEEFGEEWLDRYEDRFEYPLIFAILLICLELSLTDRVFLRKRRNSKKRIS